VGVPSSCPRPKPQQGRENNLQGRDELPLCPAPSTCSAPSRRFAPCSHFLASPPPRAWGLASSPLWLRGRGAAPCGNTTLQQSSCHWFLLSAGVSAERPGAPCTWGFTAFPPFLPPGGAAGSLGAPRLPGYMLRRSTPWYGGVGWTLSFGLCLWGGGVPVLAPATLPTLGLRASPRSQGRTWTTCTSTQHPSAMAPALWSLSLKSLVSVDNPDRHARGHTVWVQGWPWGPC